ncbi:MAG: hypothetical protein MUC85_01975 [Anaerolineales bacterium]|jgi:hypothetical protein|nr:hypothetical protein [Anaerolineales bacterium]
MIIKNPKRVLLIADISQSAADCWQETQALVDQILSKPDTGCTVEVALLGTRLIFNAEQWHRQSNLPVRLGSAASLVAPVLAAARHQLDEIAVVILIGSGEVFDLPDWVQDPAAWRLVQTGKQPLTPLPNLTHHTTDQPDGLLSGVASMPAGRIAWSSRFMSGSGGQRWCLDRAGYPMVYIPPLQGYVHLFPVLRAQFEAFLADAHPAGCEDAWYTKLVEAMLPRVPAWCATQENYESTLIGAMLPDDVTAFQAWCGSDFQPLSEQEWLEAWKWLASQPLSILTASLEDELASSARELWGMLLERPGKNTLLDLCLMRHGLIEWVRRGAEGWSGMGKPRRIHPFHNPLVDKPLAPTSFSRREKWFGFRLIRRAS